MLFAKAVDMVTKLVSGEVRLLEECEGMKGKGGAILIDQSLVLVLRQELGCRVYEAAD